MKILRAMQPAAAHVERFMNEIRPDAILTHAYEGGHPDHDACAFLACWMGERSSIRVWEMPLYHQKEASSPLIYQQFLAESSDPVLLSPSPAEISRKESMLRQHKTQASVVSEFNKARELFRPQPSYDFCLNPSPTQRGFAVCADIAIADVIESFQLLGQCDNP